jgi:hypothetical protein
MNTTKLFKWIKSHWVLTTIIAIVIFVLVLLNQKPKVISATVSPEVIVRGQNTQITLRVAVKPRLFSLPFMRVVIATRGQPNLAPDLRISLMFREKASNLGWLKKTGSDNNGNDIYQNVFTVNHSKIETIQLQIKGLLGQQIFPEVMPAANTDIRDTRLVLRLAVTARPYVLPLDPGKENDKTLEGIDSDKDGLRDDLQREIFFAYPESERARMAMGESWKAEQRYLIDGKNGNGKSATKDIRDALAAMECGYKFVKNSNPGSIIELLGYLLTSGNIVRAEAHLEASKISESLVWTQEDAVKSNCTFDWQSLPD